MQRRDFMKLAGAGVAAPAATPQAATATPGKRALMKVGTQQGSSDELLRLFAAFGVNNICSSLPSAKMDANWSVEGLTKLRERVESFGIKLDMVPAPLSSHYITKVEFPH